jgi:hypothetical protein
MRSDSAHQSHDAVNQAKEHPLTDKNDNARHKSAGPEKDKFQFGIVLSGKSYGDTEKRA